MSLSSRPGQHVIGFGHISNRSNRCRRDITGWLLRYAQPDGTSWLNRLTAAINDAGRRGSFNLVAPTANLASASGHMPIFAPVTFA